jgi:hypothetical protein
MGKTVSWKDSNEFKGNSLSRRVSWYPVVDVLIIPGRRDIEVRSGQDRDIETTPPDENDPPDRDIEVELSGKAPAVCQASPAAFTNIAKQENAERCKSVTFSQIVEVFIIPSYQKGARWQAFAWIGNIIPKKR